MLCKSNDTIGQYNKNKLYIKIWNSFWLAGWPLLYGKLFVTLWQTVCHPMANCLSQTCHLKRLNLVLPRCIRQNKKWLTRSTFKGVIFFMYIYNKPIIMTFSQWQTYVSPSGGLVSLSPSVPLALQGTNSPNHLQVWQIVCHFEKVTIMAVWHAVAHQKFIHFILCSDYQNFYIILLTRKERMFPITPAGTNIKK